MRLLLATALLATPATLSAQDLDSALEDVARDEVRALAADAAIIAAVRAQNAETSDLGQADIDALDQQWRAEADAGGGALVDRLLAAPASETLREHKAASDGRFNELFVMDAKGLNVGQSDVTSDYWQGDEAKWQETFGAGPDALFVDELEFDESTGQFQAQVSAPVVDPDTGAPIGAITVGVNVETL